MIEIKKNVKRSTDTTVNLKTLFCATYFFSYLARQNYSAVLTEIIKDLNVTKALASVAIMGSLITYGIVQILSGFLGDRFKPQRIIFVGLLGSSLINLSISFFPNIYFMDFVWCLNGAFQSLIWPPLVRMIVENLKDDYSDTVVKVSQFSYFATVLIYFLAPFVIVAFHWRAVFAISGVICFAFSFYWISKTKNIIGENSDFHETSCVCGKEKFNFAFWISLGVVPILISTFAAGILRDGISVWMPTYISDAYGKSSFVSILTGAVIPICCALFLNVFKKAGEKIGNELKSAAIFLSVAFFACVILLLFFSKIPVLDIVLMSTITACIHGVNLMLVCTVPKRFLKYGKSSTMSGIFNSAVYAGSAASALGTAVMASSLGWKSVCVLWGCLIALALTLCALWHRKFVKALEKDA